MNTQFHNIAILGRHDDARVAEAMQIITPYLAKAGIKVFALILHYIVAFIFGIGVLVVVLVP